MSQGSTNQSTCVIPNQPSNISTIGRFYGLLNRVKDVSALSRKELEILASEFEHLTTEIVCHLCHKALTQTQSQRGTL